MHKARVILDSRGYYYTMRVSVGKGTARIAAFACRVLCEENTRRPHLTCLWCRTRRVYYNKMPEKIPVDVIWLTVDRNQKYKVLKRMVRKILLTLTGWTLN